ncbi:MAG: hypothetical protein HYT39_00045 [Candidatus Sungbacteria bacterium]|nr:hypothetical protein [Candidatus Sungbacteria bacterium]
MKLANAPIGPDPLRLAIAKELSLQACSRGFLDDEGFPVTDQVALDMLCKKQAGQ